MPMLFIAAEASGDVLPIPAMSAPLSANPSPFSVDAGPLGKIYIGGALTGLAFWQGNPVPGDHDSRLDISNGQVFVQKADGWLQFYVQAGAYSLPSLGTEYFKASDLPDKTYGILPQGFLKVVLSDSFSIEAGKLPTLIGDEYTFTFENMNIERGLLWNQEPAVSRGVQASYTAGPLSLALSFNDGFYSNVYNWASGSAAWTVDGSNSLSFIGGGNLGTTHSSSFATSLPQNNGTIFNLIYTHTSGQWTISPYLQYSTVPSNTSLGLARSASTYGAALLLNYAFNDNWKLAARAEYIESSGSFTDGAPSLLYGPGSNAWSLTVTPTYQQGIFLARAEASYTRIGSSAPGYELGKNFDQSSQGRLMLEAGLLF
ncbi:MAG: porin [Alphaproteobacteria bacterium]|nr:porin [Alphaproteobacteria bacterium]